MKEEVAKVWIETLRSDRFKQSTDALHNVKEQVITTTINAEGETVDTRTIPAGHCCLGVLCELAIEAGVKVERTLIGDDGYEELYDNEAGALPASVMDWAGMNTEDGDFETKDMCDESLAALNDAGKTFAEIADIIEEYKKDL